MTPLFEYDDSARSLAKQRKSLTYPTYSGKHLCLRQTHITQPNIWILLLDRLVILMVNSALDFHIMYLKISIEEKTNIIS